MSDAINRDLAQRYDTVAYAGRANAQSHPGHLAAVAALLGIAAPPVGSARVLELGCGHGDNVLPMAEALPGARFVGCDISGQAIAIARRGAAALALDNVSFVQADLTAFEDDGAPFDYIVAHGLYSWVPAGVRDAMMALARRRLARNGLLFVSYNVYPGCHVRKAAWEMLHHHVDRIADPKEKLAQARALAALLAEPSVAQTETDGLLRKELARLATQDDSALFHDDLGSLNEPIYFHQFAAHVARHDLTWLGEAKLSMMTAAGLTPRVTQFVSSMDRLTREQYLDFARLRRFRQSIVCRADAEPSGAPPHARAAGLHAAASMQLVRTASEGGGVPEGPGDDPSRRATTRLLQFLLREAPGVVPVEEAAAWLAAEAPQDAAGARPVAALLAEASYAGTVDLYAHRPRVATAASERPRTSACVRFEAARRANVTNLRHESLHLDDPHALAVLALMDGTRTRDDLERALHARLPDGDKAQAGERMASYLAHFALHGLVVE